VQLVDAGPVDPLRHPHATPAAQIEVTSQLAFQPALHELEVLCKLVRVVSRCVRSEPVIQRIEPRAYRRIDTSTSDGDGIDLIVSDRRRPQRRGERRHLAEQLGVSSYLACSSRGHRTDT